MSLNPGCVKLGVRGISVRSRTCNQVYCFLKISNVLCQAMFSINEHELLVLRASSVADLH